MNTDTTNTRFKYASIFEGVFLMLFLPMALNLIFANLIFLLGYPLSKWVLVTSLTVTLISVYFILQRQHEVFIQSLFVACSFTISCAVAALLFYDVSWDGLAIHQNSIHRLVSGWNPIYEESINYWPGENCDLWVQHYPKASWINAALLSLLFGGMEIGKIVNLTTMVAVFFLSLAFFLRFTRLRIIYVFVTAFLLAMNPVCLPQFSSFYLDGIMACALTILALSLVRLVLHRDLISWLAVAGSCMIAANLKFTGAVYAAVFLFFTSLYVLTYEGPNPFVKISFRLGIIFFASIFLVGFNPYAINIIKKGHIFYPLNNESGPGGSEKIMKGIRPVNLIEKDRFSRLLIANFSESQSIRTPYSTKLKNPFTITKAELECWGFPGGLEAGGFGPLFGAILILTVSAVSISALFRSTEFKIWHGFIIVALLISLFINKEAWWARYAPQAYLIPIFLLVLLFQSQKCGASVAGFLISLIAVINICIISHSSFRTSQYFTKQTEDALCKLKCISKISAPNVNVLPFALLEVRLKENGINFKTVYNSPNDFTMPPAIPPKTN
jgi:hypothetical protein